MDRCEIKRRLEDGIQEYLTGTRSEAARTTRYGVIVEPLSDDGSEFDLTYRFLVGGNYCCLEPGCHFGFRHEFAWQEFRKKLQADGWQPARAMRIWHVSVQVEAGVESGDKGSGEYPFLGVPWGYECPPEIETTDAEAASSNQQSQTSDLATAEAEVAQSPGDARAWRHLAEARSFPARWAEALDPMRRAIALAPDNVFLRGSYVIDLALAGQHAEVARECEEVLRRFSGQTWAERVLLAARQRCGAAEA